MALLSNAYISPSAYNKLPHISQVTTVSKDHAADLADLRALLAKHRIPDGVSIRLIHKHFDLEENEVMAFKQLELPSFGKVLVMRPTSSLENPNLRGLNFVVNKNGILEAYEYMDGDVLDISQFPEFLAEFCTLAAQRGLQNKLGLKTKTTWDVSSWTEFEYPCRRSTVIIPQGLPAPEASSGINVNTEWKANGAVDGPGNNLSCYGHCISHCPSHCLGHELDELTSEQWYLGGQMLSPGTNAHALVNEVVMAW